MSRGQHGQRVVDLPEDQDEPRRGRSSAASAALAAAPTASEAQPGRGRKRKASEVALNDMQYDSEDDMDDVWSDADKEDGVAPGTFRTYVATLAREAAQGNVFVSAIPAVPSLEYQYGVEIRHAESVYRRVASDVRGIITAMRAKLEGKTVAEQEAVVHSVVHSDELLQVLGSSHRHERAKTVIVGLLKDHLETLRYTGGSVEAQVLRRGVMSALVPPPAIREMQSVADTLNVMTKSLASKRHYLSASFKDLAERARRMDTLPDTVKRDVEGFYFNNSTQSTRARDVCDFEGRTVKLRSFCLPVTVLYKKYVILQHSFTAPNHGKGVSDAELAVMKRALMAIESDLAEPSPLKTADDVVERLQIALPNKNVARDLTDKEYVLRERYFINATPLLPSECDSGYQTFAGLSSFYDFDITEGGHLGRRFLSCACPRCFTGQFDKCDDAELSSPTMLKGWKMSKRVQMGEE